MVLAVPQLANILRADEIDEVTFDPIVAVVMMELDAQRDIDPFDQYSGHFTTLDMRIIRSTCCSDVRWRFPASSL